MTASATGSMPDPPGPFPVRRAEDAIRQNLTEFVRRRTRTAIGADGDLFGSGLVSSLFALELVVHLENTFGVQVAGPELRMDNFRTVAAMTSLVGRLRGAGHD
jgi:methoxymalonate biosynthesis acyl carrier protein